MIICIMLINKSKIFMRFHETLTIKLKVAFLVVPLQQYTVLWQASCIFVDNELSDTRAALPKRPYLNNPIIVNDMQILLQFASA